MHALVRQVFHRLHSLDVSHEEEKLHNAGDENREKEIKVDLQLSSNSNPSSVDTGSSQTVAVLEDDSVTSENQKEIITKSEDAIASKVHSSAVPPREECKSFCRSCG